MIKFLTVFLISLFTCQIIFADTIYFKDGNIYENGETKETTEGVWIDGLLFEKSRIDKIEKMPVIKQSVGNVSKDVWRDKLMSFWGWDKKKSVNQNKNFDESIKKRSIDDKIKQRALEEKIRAEEITSNAKRRAAIIKQGEQSVENKKEASFTHPSFGNQKMADIKVSHHTSPGQELVQDANTGEVMTMDEADRRVEQMSSR